MWLVTGLGNPGRAYEGTRHNVGFDAVDLLARQADVRLKRSWRFAGEVAEVTQPQRLWLLKPRTFMNRSGEAVAPMLRRKGLARAALIVLVDDTELPCGKIRVRPRGSAGGHNGLKSIIAALGGDDFVRIRIGVGGKPGDREMVAHVLSRFHPDDRSLVDEAVERAVEAVGCVITEGVERAMNRYNGA